VIQPAQTFVAGEGGFVENGYVKAGGGELSRARRTSRPAADDQHVTPLHGIRPSCDSGKLSE